ncbi:MAG: GNAT family N-acetyltransferase [Patescibacteria group bacterium]
MENLKKESPRIIFLEGKKVILRPVNKETDLQKSLKWINDPGIRQFISVFLPTNKKQEEEWFDREEKNNVRLAIETKEGKYIGNISLAGIDYRHGIAEVGIFIGEKQYWNRGYGTDATMILLEYAFNVLNLRKIKWRAFAFNGRSIDCSKKCGYKVEAVLKKEWFKDGKYVDMVCLAIFKKDFLKTWRDYQNGS